MLLANGKCYLLVCLNFHCAKQEIFKQDFVTVYLQHLKLVSLIFHAHIK